MKDDSKKGGSEGISRLGAFLSRENVAVTAGKSVATVQGVGSDCERRSRSRIDGGNGGGERGKKSGGMLLLQHRPDNERSGFGERGSGFERRCQGVEGRFRQGGETAEEDDQSADEWLETVEVDGEVGVGGEAGGGSGERSDGRNAFEGGRRDAVDAVLDVTVDVRHDLRWGGYKRELRRRGRMGNSD